jgi:hypothetical protein
MSAAVPIVCGLCAAFGWYGTVHVWRTGRLSERSRLSRSQRREYAMVTPTATGMFTLWTIGSAIDVASDQHGLVWVLLAFLAMAGGLVGGLAMFVSLNWIGRPYWAVPPPLRPRDVQARAAERRARNASSSSKRPSGSSTASPSNSRSRRTR